MVLVTFPIRSASMYPSSDQLGAYEWPMPVAAVDSSALMNTTELPAVQLRPLSDLTVVYPSMIAGNATSTSMMSTGEHGSVANAALLLSKAVSVTFNGKMSVAVPHAAQRLLPDQCQSTVLVL